MRIGNGDVLKESGRMLAAALSAAFLFGVGPSARSAEPARAPAGEVVRLWPGTPPGTESWSGKEIELDADLPGSGKVHIITNVTVPTLTVIRPTPGKAGKTAMLVVPGGAFRALAWDLDGTEFAEWLASRGITAFLLKYRVRPPGDTAPAGAESFDHFLARTEPAQRVALADADRALRYIRANSEKLGLAADRVGMIGSSAGAITTLAAALEPDASSRPDFAIAVYGALPSDRTVPADAPPLFLVAAQDDPQIPYEKSLQSYARWTAAHRPAELHLYEKGGHGFGMRALGLPVGNWPSALEAWLRSRGLLEANPR